jgi:signal transduction histidine kinase
MSTRTTGEAPRDDTGADTTPDEVDSHPGRASAPAPVSRSPAKRSSRIRLTTFGEGGPVLLRMSLRARLTLLATALLAVGLAAGGLLLVVTVSQALLRAADSGARQTARDVAALVDARRLSDPVPSTGASGAVVQVVDADGRVISGSPGADRLVPLLRPDQLRRAVDGEVIALGNSRAGVYDAQLRAVAVQAGPRDDRQTVIVAVGTSEVSDSVRVVRTVMLIGAPILLGLLAYLSWMVTGWTLRPVEELRRGAEEIAGKAGARRLPLPVAQDEVHRLAETLNRMLARLEAGRERQRAFVADAAHELRSPLASVRTQLEVAHRLGPASMDAEVIEDLLTETDRMSRLVSDLLLLARLDEDQIAGMRRAAERREVVDLSLIAADVAERVEGGRVPVEVDAGDSVLVDGDPDALLRVLSNLVDNAVRHARSRVRVVCRAGSGAGGSLAEVTVTDDGPGIAVGDRERVFARFTRLDDARDRDAGGAGLGLAIVREVVRAHGGTVTLDAADAGAVDPGLVATVRLPLHPPDAP